MIAWSSKKGKMVLTKGLQVLWTCIRLTNDSTDYIFHETFRIWNTLSAVTFETLMQKSSKGTNLGTTCFCFWSKLIYLQFAKKVIFPQKNPKISIIDTFWSMIQKISNKKKGPTIDPCSCIWPHNIVNYYNTVYNQPFSDKQILCNVLDAYEILRTAIFHYHHPHPLQFISGSSPQSSKE